MWRKPVQMIRLATSTPGHVEVNRWSATVHSRAPELRLQQSLCFYFSSAGLTALPLRIVEEMPWTFLHLFFLFLQSSTSSIWKQTWNYAIAILGDGEANHFEFQIYRHKWRRFRSEEGNTNLNKFFHFDENIEIYREMRLWSVPCIDWSTSGFKLAQSYGPGDSPFYFHNAPWIFFVVWHRFRGFLGTFLALVTFFETFPWWIEEIRS